MSKKKRKKNSNQRSVENHIAICSLENWETLSVDGYIPLSQNPEIISAVNKISNLIGGMTIHLMENTERGDQRIKNGLSRKIDIDPNRFMTRNTLMSAVVRCLLLEGDGNAVIYPETKRGLIQNLFLLPPNSVGFLQDGFGYKIIYSGNQYECDDFVHIVLNPDPNQPWKGTGSRKSLKMLAKTLNQASTTKQGFMESKWKPSVIVKADALTDEFSTPEGRKKLLNRYIESSEAGEPWIIPAEQFEVTSIKPLSLNDLAIKDSVEIDKKTVAGILDIPSFVLGVGAFNKEEWNNFINTRLRDICVAIEQALTRTLIVNPNWYFKFNYRSLFSYDIETLSNVGCNLYTRGIITGNEVRDSLGYSPEEGLDELVMLENYIPAGMIGEQKKLVMEGDKNE